MPSRRDDGRGDAANDHRKTRRLLTVARAPCETASATGAGDRCQVRHGTDLRARLDAADDRDRAARERDEQAVRRDLLATAREEAIVTDLAQAAGEDGGLSAVQALLIAGELFARATQVVALCAADRQAAAADREHAARDRLEALADRHLLAQQLVLAETDALTGARTRAAGMQDLNREVERARRADGSLVVAFIDVVGLKSVNDTLGHVAGDELLRRVVAHVRAHLRAYDLIIRLGGDEFLCVLSGTGLPEAHRRIEQVAAALARSPEGGEIRVGLAELTATDTAGDLVARADSELLGRVRDGNGSRRGAR
ncbi:MAG: GGDEF domain-containing protein [Thermoleophilia bacterium]